MEDIVFGQAANEIDRQFLGVAIIFHVRMVQKLFGRRRQLTSGMDQSLWVVRLRTFGTNFLALDREQRQKIFVIFYLKIRR